MAPRLVVLGGLLVGFLANAQQPVCSSSKVTAMSRSALEAKLAETPADLTLNRQYLRMIRVLPDPKPMEAVIERYKQLAAEHGGDVIYQYLYAAALVGRNTAEAVTLLDSVLDKNPDF